jgi:hypothetical protein
MTHRLLHALLAIVACSAVSTASGSPAADPSVTREADCRWASEAPAIDGKLDDPAWKTASVIDRFPAFWNQAETPKAHSMKARLLWDREALYYSAEMVDPDVRAFGTKHNDHLWNGDVFEMFFKPKRDRPEYFEFQVNPKSVLFEAAFLGTSRSNQSSRVGRGGCRRSPRRPMGDGPSKAGFPGPRFRRLSPGRNRARSGRSPSAVMTISAPRRPNRS